MNPTYTTVPSSQRGAVLIVVLLLLLAMTMLGLLSLRGAIMEERMGAGMYDRSLAFQAAESALREAEQRLMQPGILSSFPTGANACNNGLCSEPEIDVGTLERVDDPAFDDWVDATEVDGLAGTPQYFIEDMGEAPGWPGCHLQTPVHPTCIRQRYRITARSSNDDRATVVLQTSFAGT